MPGPDGRLICPRPLTRSAPLARWVWSRLGRSLWRDPVPLALPIFQKRLWNYIDANPVPAATARRIVSDCRLNTERSVPWRASQKRVFDASIAPRITKEMLSTSRLRVVRLFSPAYPVPSRMSEGPVEAGIRDLAEERHRQNVTDGIATND